MGEEDGAVVGVRYTNNGGDSENLQVETKSPAKNRLKGSAVGDSSNMDAAQIPVSKRHQITLFERAAGSWWNPKFDSRVLEKQHLLSIFPQTRRRFQYAMFYIIASCAAWGLYFALCGSEANWLLFTIASAVMLAVSVVLLLVTYTKYYRKFYLIVSIMISLLLCAVLLGSFHSKDPDISGVGSFTGSIALIIMMYTVIPMPLFLSVLIGGCYSVGFEVLSIFTHGMNESQLIVGRILMHICIHIIGIHIFINLQARQRSTFWKVGQSVMARRDLLVEKKLKDKMIYSLMPPSVAKDVIEKARGDNDESILPKRLRNRKKGSKEKAQIRFRPFTMSSMNEVSILFADIVGFTKMSSNKTAEHLVGLLNDLFGRFDKLCTASGCEKISTLGDCYYCVSGCPEPRPDHAKCCVEMGRGMIEAIKQFDEDNKEEVNMRVGVHTGTVLCGIVGTRRFKFDVFSNDVTFANLMESTGRPGRVHVSELSLEYLDDEYELEEGEPVDDIRTYKVLVEDYDIMTSKYRVKHIQDERMIKTYFVIRKKGEGENDVSVKDPNSPENLRRQSVCKNAPNHLGPAGDGDVENPAELLGRRSSDFFAASDLALNEPSDQKEEQVNGEVMLPMNEALRKAHKLREQSDMQVAQCIQEDMGNKDYFYKPPINQCTLNFVVDMLESEYREHYLEDEQTIRMFAAPRFSAMMDMIVSLLILILISICCFIEFEIRTPWIVIFVIAIVVEVFMVVPLVLHVFKPERIRVDSGLGRFFIGWYPRHITGAVIIMLPTIAVYANFSCNMFSMITQTDIYFAYLIIVSLLHYCNFSIYSSWMKSSLATVVGLILVCLILIGACKYNTVTPPNDGSNITVYAEASYLLNATVNSTMAGLYSGKNTDRYEVILDMILILLLVWFLNREFEISHRLGFHGDVQAAVDREKMENEKNEADWLLHNIIPDYISDQLKETSKYSRNHKDVGVIFASICNFDEMYDESFEGGIEYLRVLNELVADFEDLLTMSKYKDVEKIKTISSCFMGACGLNPALRSQNKQPLAHLYNLMDFCIDMHKALDRFNESIFNFDFIMKIGFNYGEVTAGVIGTTKLLYDIWGDTVNIASRMYSTGEGGRVQVTAQTAETLGDMFEFEYRGTTIVKGKGNMETYLLVKKRDGASWE
ncbi:adenylate cyclase type 9-like [Tubulanus polymorphus]|uniref:adenylate cyclase type 9-like n=1 Tax=Tubulanus polymorphus TaxID=672921 RepID=UPI003DA554ED